MKLWNKKIDCCGCTACTNICPKQCISMKKDEEGFEYPVIDEKRCVKCGKCLSVCPIKTPHERSESTAAYIARNNNASVLAESSSGGLFTAVAELIIEKGGLVCGVIFNKEFDVVHILTNKKDDVKK